MPRKPPAAPTLPLDNDESPETSSDTTERAERASPFPAVGGARTVPDLPGIVTRVDFLPDSSALVVLAGPHVRVFPLDTRLLEVEPARVLARAQDMAGLVLEGSELRAAARAHPPAE